MSLLLVLLACGSKADAPPITSPSSTSVGTTSSSNTRPEPTMPTDPATEGSWSRTSAAGTRSTTTVRVTDPGKAYLTYELATDHQPQRDDGPTTRTVAEAPGDPQLRSGSVVQDALFALAMAEVHEASVGQITDGAFADGAPTPCECFETGEKWTYVWTRDTAYAAHLALAWIDPQRTADSLRYKLASGKPGSGVGGPFLVQDTGSGGSWPVSTDRVTWALGAMEVWRQLPAGDSFGPEAAAALANTVRQDHDLVRGTDGRMRGEMSFLDWREQSYPLPTAHAQTLLAETEALGTNVAHLAALRGAATLAREVSGDPSSADTFDTWADELATAIDRGLWRDDLGGWASWAGRAHAAIIGTAGEACSERGQSQKSKRLVQFHFPTSPRVIRSSLRTSQTPRNGPHCG